MDETDDRDCGHCVFFVFDENRKSQYGCCHGIPVQTVNEDGDEIKPKWPRRSSYDSACGIFSSK